MKHLREIIILILVVVTVGCRKDPAETPVTSSGPTPFDLDIPAGLPQMPIPADNPMTLEGVDLGRHLFYDKQLSDDNTQSCATCHQQQFGFGDPRQFSVGITGAVGTRQSMALTNVGWGLRFFWDGRSMSLEEQALQPVINPVEMNTTWPKVIQKLNADPLYADKFEAAFGEAGIDSTKAAKALAQFMRTLISGNSKFDKFSRKETSLTPDELAGFDLFRDFSKGDCIHCHVFNPPMFTDHSFRNNGFFSTPFDNGVGDVTNDINDSLKFKVPSLRNIEVSGPYMHNGALATLDDVLNFYVNDVHFSSTIDPVMFDDDAGNSTLGMNLTPAEQQQLKAFLLTLTDTEFLTNPAHSDPF